jgi:hypothetical protein
MTHPSVDNDTNDLAELLRSAAEKLREQATAARAVAPGAWFQAPSDPRPNRAVIAEGQVTPVATTHENCELPKLADYIALTHPAVGLAFAEVLDHLGDDVYDGRAEEKRLPRVDGGTYTVVVNEYGSSRYDWTAAVEAARQVLRTATEVTA